MVLSSAFMRAEDGYRLWLRYDRIGDESIRRAYEQALPEIVFPSATASPGAETLAAARSELTAGLEGLLGVRVPWVGSATKNGALVAGTSADPALRGLVTDRDLAAAGEEGFILRHVSIEGRPRLLLLANREIGILHGTFALLRRLQTHQPLERVDIVSAPRIQRRVLNHWDNLDGTIERGYSGYSIWEWFVLPDWANPRYRDYARAAASVGINGAVLNNVNANALILSPDYLEKVAVIARELRPYGIRVYLTARFSAPTELGGLKTSDPLAPEVQQWWRAKTDEIYRLIPDFGGFLVKANSEGQPGPQNYGRNHADGANMMADALAPHGGIVMWRAFVYDNNIPDDRAKQAYNEFRPLDGRFRPNVIVQVKTGPIDFMPREAFHPLFGAMPRTPLGLEVQITQEYMGASVAVAYLGTSWKETLDSDTHRAGPGSTVARVVDGSLHQQPISLIAGVSNVGSDRNWTGHPLAAANWYAFGRLAWDHTLTAADIADEWIRMTFSSDPTVLKTASAILMSSRETDVDYQMPLGLHHIMIVGHHFGPGPWVDNLPRKDWTSVYYHRADTEGIGFDRTPKGSNALEVYAPAVAKRWGDLATCPDEFLLWFHHLPWDYRMRSGRTLWDELCLRYQRGVDGVRSWQAAWEGLRGRMDSERFEHVRALLARQERDAREWRDACIQYFAQFSKRPVPAGVEPAAHPLEYYINLKRHFVPGDPDN